MKAKILAISLLSFASIVLASCTANNGGNSLEPSNSTSKVDAFEEFKNETLQDNEVRINLRKSKAVLRWKPVANATGYNVYVSDSTFGEYDAFNSGPITKTNFDNGAYPFGYYKVTAIVNDKEVPINDEPVSVFSNTLMVTDNDDMNKVQERIESVHSRLEKGSDGQFSSERFAMMFYPGEYPRITAKVGYYTNLMGLGTSPEDVVLNNVYVSDDVLSNKNSTCTFWRGVENVTSDSDVMWCVSQATSFRRNKVNGNLALSSSGWSSGGFLANTVVTGSINSGSQQQWFTRNTEFRSWSGSSYNMVFTGSSKAPEDTWTGNHFTNIETTERIAEKPFIYVDDYDFKVCIPKYNENTVDTTWNGKDDVENSIDLLDFYVANPLTDDSKTLNAALDKYEKVLFVPGIYNLDEPLLVNKPNSILLGMGYATLKITDKNTKAAIITKDVEGIRIANLLVDAGKKSENMVVIGEENSSSNNKDNPIVLSDLFLRIGGVQNVHTETNIALLINSNYVIGDNFWLWRADHSNGVAWKDYENERGQIIYGNPAETGIYVNGDHVLCYALMVEHFRKYQTYWKGEHGKVIMYQSETPYRVDSQDEWMSSETNKGYASYKVDDNVKNHDGIGIGVYWVNYTDVLLSNAIEVPVTENVKMYHLVTTNFTSSNPGYIENVINGIGGSGQGGSARYVESYPNN